MKVIGKIAESAPIQIVITVIIYSLYAAIIGISLVPSFLLLFYSFSYLILPAMAAGRIPEISAVILFALSTGGGLYIFYITGIIVMSLSIRVLSIGIKPGRYEITSPTTLRWLIYSGIYNLAVRLILPIMPMTYFSNLFFKIIGCKMGKNVKLNTWMLNDSYLLTIGDNVVIGGNTDISCHLFENNQLILKEITIDDNTLIGAHCYISPGVSIGKNCIIGLRTFIRSDKIISDNSKITSIAGMPLRKARKIEKGSNL